MMGIIHLPEPERKPQRPPVSADTYPLGARWMSDDTSVWEVEWDNQDKRHMWTLVFEPRMRPEPVSRAEAVSTGQPEAQLLACTRCGVLLWDIESHYNHSHQEGESR